MAPQVTLSNLIMIFHTFLLTIIRMNILKCQYFAKVWQMQVLKVYKISKYLVQQLNEIKKKAERLANNTNDYSTR